MKAKWHFWAFYTWFFSRCFHRLPSLMASLQTGETRSALFRSFKFRKPRIFSARQFKEFSPGNNELCMCLTHKWKPSIQDNLLIKPLMMSNPSSSAIIFQLTDSFIYRKKKIMNWWPVYNELKYFHYYFIFWRKYVRNWEEKSKKSPRFEEEKNEQLSRQAASV